jgi:hypothetical protein
MHSTPGRSGRSLHTFSVARRNFNRISLFLVHDIVCEEFYGILGWFYTQLERAVE